MTPRPKRRRMLQEPPFNSGFVPSNGEYDTTEGIVLLYEEYEALRLSDYEGLSQEEAAQKMDVSRPTFTRIYKATREKIATAFVENKQIFIDGGNVDFQASWYRCHNCGSVFKSREKGEEDGVCRVCGSQDILPVQEAEGPENCGKKERRSHGKRAGMGRGGDCICPRCDFRLPHQPGVPCSSLLCPHCEIRMVREGSPHHKLILDKRKNKGNE